MLIQQSETEVAAASSIGETTTLGIQDTRRGSAALTLSMVWGVLTATTEALLAATASATGLTKPSPSDVLALDSSAPIEPRTGGIAGPALGNAANVNSQPISSATVRTPVSSAAAVAGDSIASPNASATPKITVAVAANAATSPAETAVIARPEAVAIALTPPKITAPLAAAGNDTGGPSGQGGSLLPAGYLSTHGNQIVDAAGNPVRIDAVGWAGTDTLTFAPYGLWQSSLEQNINEIKADGFNTIRIPWTDLLLNASPEFVTSYAAFNPALDPELWGATSLQLLDDLVADAGNAGLKVIFDHHDDDGGPGGWGGQQANGLWIDSGPGTNGTDGSGTTGTVTAAKFLADSIELAKNFAGNSTVIGFDLDNEPTSAGNINWGQGGPTDIQAMYTQVGDAIQAVDPGALIITEGPLEYSGPAPGMPAGFGGGDLSGVASDPVTLTIPNKIVYSVHEYPPDLSDTGSYNSAQQIAEMNAGWGFLETNNIAPVWIGEMGSNMTSPADQVWIQTVLNYMNGEDGAEGGPNFSGNEQPISGDWWDWGSYPGSSLEGVETAWGSGTYWPAQQVATDQLLYTPTGAPSTSAPLVATAKMRFLAPANGSVVLSGSAVGPVGGAIAIATVLNLETAATNGWAVELDTADILKGLTGGVLTAIKAGAYLITPTSDDGVVAAGSFTSFSFSVASVGISSAISAHLVRQT
ncbi:MAG: cellulase family glycosylhydrolase [Rhodopila sp.]|jgi:aryl-phospho-beta-D-glucosidase BglC (GH1 family)